MFTALAGSSTGRSAAARDHYRLRSPGGAPHPARASCCACALLRHCLQPQLLRKGRCCRLITAASPSLPSASDLLAPGLGAHTQLYARTQPYIQLT